MEFIDGLHVKGEMSDKDFKALVDKEAKTRDIQRYGRDGITTVFSEHREYRGFAYYIKIMRYYQINVPLDQIKGMNDYGKWAVLEYSEELKPLANFLQTIERITSLYEFLWQDTLHCGQNHWMLPQAVEWLEQQAHEDIDQLFTLKDKITEEMKRITGKYEMVMTQLNKTKETTEIK